VSSALEEDPKRDRDGATGAHDVDRLVEVDVRPLGYLERRAVVVARPKKLLEPPPAHALRLGLARGNGEFRSRHSPCIARAGPLAVPASGDFFVTPEALGRARRDEELAWGCRLGEPHGLRPPEVALQSEGDGPALPEERVRRQAERLEHRLLVAEEHDLVRLALDPPAA
jgi:hypothetical protein